MRAYYSPVKPMPTQKQMEAARSNGAKSLGPVTPEGKQIAAGNAFRHGLLSGSIVLNGELVSQFEALHDSLLAEHQPATQSELALVRALAAALWRQLRVWGFQKLTVDNQTATSKHPAWFAAMQIYIHEKDIPTLLRYETTFSRQFSRALKELNVLKSRRSGIGPPLPAVPLTGSTWEPLPDSTEHNCFCETNPATRNSNKINS